MTISLAIWQHHVLMGSTDVAGRLALALCSSALKAGEFLADGSRFGVKPGEESVTDQLLVDLAKGVPELRIHKVARHVEVDVGADWEWWIEGQAEWFGFLVQAKRVHQLPSKRWSYNLGYRPAAKEGVQRPRQIETLLASSDALQIPAMYALYNEAGTGLQYHRPQIGNRCVVPGGADGITALSARSADYVLRIPEKTPQHVGVDEISKFAFPLPCLAHCLTDQPHGAWPTLDDDLPGQLGFTHADAVDIAYRAARFLLQVERARLPNVYASAALDERVDDIARLARAVRSQPPEYVPLATEESLLDPAPPPVVDHPLSREGGAPRFLATLALPPHLRELKIRDARG